MNCSPFDLRDYYFEVLPAEQRRAVEGHLAGCEGCAGELERVRLTGMALAAVAEEEIPRRIGFVSDKVFEPSPLARWWQAFWMSGARMASAAMALLAVAILVHAFYRPQPVEVTRGNPIVVAAAADPAAIQAAVDRAVAKAVSATEARYDIKLQQIVAENGRQKLVIQRAAETIEAMDRRERVMMVASNRESMPVMGQ
jgi:negative regulator of sigma E activity